MYCWSDTNYINFNAIYFKNIIVIKTNKTFISIMLDNDLKIPINENI